MPSRSTPTALRARRPRARFASVALGGGRVRGGLRVAGLVAVAAAGLAAGCGLAPLSDLRTADIRAHGISAEDEARGRDLLALAAEAHGGATWAQHATWEVVLEDRWGDSFWIKRRSPWPDDARQLQLQFTHGTGDGRVTFLDGEQAGTTWGVAGGQTYSQAPGQPPVWGDAPRMASRLPTMQFLVEFPQRITEAPFVGLAGRRDIDGHATDVVFAAWGSVEPDPDMDPFRVYIDAESRRIRAMQYTVRKSGRTRVGHRFWSDLRPVEGVWVPFHQTSLREFEAGDTVHSFYVSAFRFDPVGAATLAQPRPTRSGPTGMNRSGLRERVGSGQGR